MPSPLPLPFCALPPQFCGRKVVCLLVLLPLQCSQVCFARCSPAGEECQSADSTLLLMFYASSACLFYLLWFPTTPVLPHHTHSPIPLPAIVVLLFLPLTHTHTPLFPTLPFYLHLENLEGRFPTDGCIVGVMTVVLMPAISGRLPACAPLPLLPPHTYPQWWWW